MIGKLGSGKTALLLGLMNEMENIFFSSQGLPEKEGIDIEGNIALVT